MFHRVLLYWAIFTFVPPIAKNYFNLTKKDLTYAGTYVKYVSEDIYNQYIFNINRDYRKEAIKSSGDRPIYIFQTKYLNYEYLGYSISNQQGCIIFINNIGYDEEITVLHEILHCYGFQHSEDRLDLMYFENYYGQTRESAFKYLKEIESLK